ncbi:ATP-dependent DNA helicase PIF1 [Artemisia annua]|uniref:ATP-dependent DNA helicase PIF1 n=1 Tax=Artemisia annua TaxID=35608 RepID=A0A2U1LRS7_ARTAN|nr:ATP-dependent DNA helicase PIF1 [Artemisia annua]
MLISDSDDHVGAVIQETYNNWEKNQWDLTYFQDRAILAPTHQEVDKINDRMMSMLPGPEKHKENKHYEKSRTEKLLILESDDECNNYEVSLSEFPAICDTKSTELKKELLLSDLFENFDAIACNLPTIDALLKSESHTILPVCSLEVYEDVNFNILTIDADLLSWETPLETTFMEFKRLSNIEDGLFTYDLLMRKFQIEYMNSNNAMTKSSNQSYNKGNIQPVQPSYMPYSEQYWGLDKSNLDYERIYAKSEILFHKKLVSLMDISLEEWLELKYGDLEFAPMDEVKRIVTSWLKRSLKSNSMSLWK